VIAHRGASRIAPENTIPAFLAAWDCGASWIEADVQPSADNVPIMFHDAELERTTNGTGPVRLRSAAELAALDAGSWFPTGSTTTFAHTPVPPLAEVVRLLDSQRSLLLEIKGAHTREQVRAEMAVVLASGWTERVLFQSFEVQALQHVLSIEPGRPVGLLVEQLHPDPVAICRSLGAVAYNPAHELLRDQPELLDTLHAAGIAIFVWTADDPADWVYLSGLGVDGIITNTPAELLRWQQLRPE